ncbi:unnamed protein product [Caenorhabditis angaria]|uniref:Uncharacterized protein n=1 Tax=Caenorhabditis angaria TaxID=860376 RepID=A0A9P1N415_9PELO|nr:unnamed protein product [Caenorhabditis angaria]
MFKILIFFLIFAIQINCKAVFGVDEEAQANLNSGKVMDDATSNDDFLKSGEKILGKGIVKRGVPSDVLDILRPK